MRCERIYTSGSEVKQLSQGIGLLPPSVKLPKISNSNRLKKCKATSYPSETYLPLRHIGICFGRSKMICIWFQIIWDVLYTHDHVLFSSCSRLVIEL